MKIKASKKIIMAALALLMAVGLAAGSTFAWFSMNNKVTVNGMEVKTKVSSNLLIATDVAGATTKKDDSQFSSGPLSQELKGILEPVSTSDAKTFFYSTDAKADGSKNKVVASSGFTTYDSTTPADGINSSAYANKFSEDYGVTTSDAVAYDSSLDGAVAYVDYVFQLKATSTNPDQNEYINLTTLELEYAGAADASAAHRVAIFVEDITNGASDAALNTAVGTYKASSSANFTSEGVASAVVSGETAYVGSSYVSSPISLATVTKGTTKYYKVTVRLWLEGQDTTCNNTTFMPLTNKWSLNLELSLDTTQNIGVTFIDKTIA